MSIRREIAVLSCLCVAAAACGNLIDKLKGGADAGAADAAVATETGSGISNEAAITRYPEEAHLDAEVKLISSAVVRSAWPGTDMVATLTPETSVLLLAAKGDGVLVVFDDPSGAKKMGWIGAKSVPPITIPEAGSDEPEEKKGTTPTTPTVKTDAGATSKDAGAATKDAGAVVDAGASKDAGAATKDAGAATTKDAGGGSGGSSGPLVKDMVGSKCDTGYAEFPKGEKKCRKTCTADNQCSGGKCVQKTDNKYCYSTK